jgi:hypothetical protein
MVKKGCDTMIITSSAVAMSSNRSYSSIKQEEKVSVDQRQNSNSSVVLQISEESLDMMADIKAYKKAVQEETKQREADNLRNVANLQTEASKNSTVPNVEDNPKITLLKKLLESFRRAFGEKNFNFDDPFKNTSGKSQNLSFENLFASASSSSSQSVVVASSASSGSSGSHLTSTLQRTTVTSGFFAETELTAYEATGIAKTADGREINFGVSVELSRGFSEKYQSLLSEQITVCDPLVINLDSSSASVSDMKFLFDLDSDGTEEEISFTTQGSGFLALDRNGDGKINDGSELFGTKSQDGFADLAEYDEDGNGWIDEADSIFKDLKIWTKDADGNDQLIDLKSADVGAIYLGKADTQFSLNNLATNDTNAIIRSTGVYLKESGGVGTVQHVDLAI